MNKFFLFFLVALAGCSSSPKNGLKVIATPVPHAELLEFVKPALKLEGIDLNIVVVDDYNTPNRALADREADANFFQHIPFMEAQMKQYGYPIQSLAKVEIEPMGLYSKKMATLLDLEEGATLAIPNDPSNEGRALLLLQAHDLIQLRDPGNLQATPLDISDNPKNFQFIEVDAAMLPRTLEDVSAAVINTNFALEAGLNPTTDALIIEGAESPYANIIAIRTGDENRADLQALKAAMTSEKMRQFIEEKYKGAVLPAF